MRTLIVLYATALIFQIAALTKPAIAAQEAPEFCRNFKTAQDYEGVPKFKWDRLFPRCVTHTIGDGTVVDPSIYDIVYRTALQHQNGIRDDRDMALDYYKLLLRDRNRDWRIIVSRRVDEYGAGLTSLGYPYRSSARISANIERKLEEFKREVSGRNRISIGETGAIEIPEHLNIGQKFVAMVGAAIIADIARGLAGESLPQDVQEVHDRFNAHQRYLQEQETSTWNHGASAEYLP